MLPKASMILFLAAFLLSFPPGAPAADDDQWVIILPLASPVYDYAAPARPGRGWLALAEKEDGWVLEKTDLNLKWEKEAMPGPEDGVKLFSRQHPKAEVLLRHPALKPGRVETPPNPAWAPPLQPYRYIGGPLRRHTHSFSFKGRNYWLDLFSNIHGLPETYEGYQLVDKLFLYSAQPLEPAVSQVLTLDQDEWKKDQGLPIPAFLEKYSRIDQIWTGDLDGDGFPDLIVFYYGYIHRGACLYLSSVSKPGHEGELPGRSGCQMMGYD